MALYTLFNTIIKLVVFINFFLCVYIVISSLYFICQIRKLRKQVSNLYKEIDNDSI